MNRKISEVEKAKSFLRSKTGYLKVSAIKVAQLLNISEKSAKTAQKAIKIEIKSKVVKSTEPIIYKSEKTEKKQFKRLFWDIETSPNIVFSWNIGPKINLGHESIIKERAIICICYKWAGEKQVHSLKWDKGNDKQMILEFIKILNSADESIGHNSDSYDLKWLKARCLYHNIPAFPTYQTVDTLKLARSGFRFNSNRLDYLGRFFGFGGKADTGGFNTWKSIVLDNSSEAMNTMIKYCKIDVIRLEQVYNRLNPYTTAKTHVGVVMGKDKCTCPNCGSDENQSRGKLTSLSGIVKNRRSCNECNKYFTIILKKEKNDSTRSSNKG